MAQTARMLQSVHIRTMAAFLIAGLGISAPAAAQNPNVQWVQAQQSCIADWSEAGPIVRREGLLTIERVGRIVRDKAAGEIVNSALCTTDGRYVYRLTVRGGKGGLTTLVVDARQPFGP